MIPHRPRPWPTTPARPVRKEDPDPRSTSTQDFHCVCGALVRATIFSSFTHAAVRCPACGTATILTHLTDNSHDHKPEEPTA